MHTAIASLMNNEAALRLYCTDGTLQIDDKANTRPIRILQYENHTSTNAVAGVDTQQKEAGINVSTGVALRITRLKSKPRCPSALRFRCGSIIAPGEYYEGSVGNDGRRKEYRTRGKVSRRRVP